MMRLRELILILFIVDVSCLFTVSASDGFMAIGAFIIGYCAKVGDSPYPVTCGCQHCN